jgi:hypothetical protein
MDPSLLTHMSGTCSDVLLETKHPRKGPNTPLWLCRYSVVVGDMARKRQVITINVADCLALVFIFAVNRQHTLTDAMQDPKSMSN